MYFALNPSDNNPAKLCFVAPHDICYCIFVARFYVFCRYCNCHCVRL